MSMNYNPYAAPNADPRAMTGTPGAPGSPQPWDIGEVIGEGWEAVKRDWPVLIFAPILAGIIQQIPAGFYAALTTIGAIEEGSVVALLINLLCTLLGWIIGTFFLVGQLRIYLAAARGQSLEFGMLFGGADRFLPLLVTQLLFVIAWVLGFALLLVPGFVVLAGLFFAQFYCVDANMGPIEALTASWESTSGQKGQIFLLGVVVVLIGILGFLAFCIGIFPAVAIGYVAAAATYLRISGRGAAPAPAGPPFPPQGGGFGPPQQGGGFGPPPQGGGFGPPQASGGFGPPPAGWGPPQGGGWGH